MRRSKHGRDTRGASQGIVSVSEKSDSTCTAAKNPAHEAVTARLKEQTTGEEIANAVTHGIGVALSIAGLVLLVVFATMRGDAWRVVSFSIYGATLIILYIASTLYHSLTNIRLKRFFRKMDHISIFLLIAGTYTPITLVCMRGPWGWTIFGLIWGLAVAGVVLKAFFMGRFEKTAIVLYVAMGWLIIIAVKPMIQMVPPGTVMWLVIGGVSYTAGVIFYALKKMPYHHAVWHLFVLGGSVCQYMGIVLHLTHVA
ncbi:MAG: hemolysin III family protein [Deltaproteobacteria bacterium]|nr:hemolysin III family protein [Candidatus Zymogenaceae bacterium]